MSSLKHRRDSSAVGDETDDDKNDGIDPQAITDSFVTDILSLDVDIVKMLVKSDFEIDYQDIRHHSALHTALNLIAFGAKRWADYITRDKGLVNKHLNPWKTFLRIVKDLLESGRFNVNSLNYSSNTTLHCAVEHCMCRILPCDEYKAMVCAIIDLLLKNNANINAKTRDGETPLMKASRNGCNHIVQLLLDWRDEFGAGVDLNARDMYGETALIKAAKGTHVDIVELLLQHGCLDEFQDHRGFYALHAVIYGRDLGLIGDASRDFLGSIGLDVSANTLVLLDRCDAKLNQLRETISKNLKINDDIQKIVRMLITSGRANVNSKDFRGNTVLDLAVKSKLRICQETIEMIMKYGDSLCFSAKSHRENSDHTFQNADNFGKTSLHRLSAVLPEMSPFPPNELFESKYLLDSNPYKELFEAMAVAKDHRGRTALHYAVLPSTYVSSFDDRVLLKNILKLANIINERDKYGRTPLHYCQDMDVYESLVKQGEQIPDIDGKTPQDFKQLRREEGNRLDLSLKATRVPDSLGDYKWVEWIGDDSKLEDQLNMRKLDAEIIWKDSNYAYRDHFSTTMCDKIQQFMNRLSEEVRKKDPRFECQPMLIGSAEEGTKVGLPDEFDFNLILTKFSELCEVVPSPEAPSGFVHLKRRSYNGERWHADQDFNNEESFDRFFNSDGLLLTTEIASRFRIMYMQVLSEPEFWDGEDFFEWETHNEISLACSREKKQTFEVANSFRPSTHPCSSIRLKLNRPINGRYMFTDISLDIVPCIRINDFWPGEALSSDKIKCEGCHLVFDQPQRHYPWTPFSDPFARISFAPAEGRMIKECSAVARAAYMVGKQMLHLCNKTKLTYVLKTCLLYCIEALKDCSNSSLGLHYDDIDPTELRLFVEKLMLCFHEFYIQDFLPCYMMPSFKLPIEDCLKSKHDKLLNDLSFRYPLFACKLYRSFSTTESEIDVCIPTAEPLNENFNREELLRKLSMYNNRSSVERIRVQPDRLAKERNIRSDSKDELQVIENQQKEKKTDEREEDQSEKERFGRNELNDVSCLALSL